MKYSGMLLTLKFFYKIQGNKLNKDNGLGIIPYKYKQAESYYTQLKNTYSQAELVKKENNIDLGIKQETVIIDKRERKKKTLDFSY